MAAKARSTDSEMARERDYYREELNHVGAKLLRVQEELQGAHQEAQRAKTLTRLTREVFRRVNFSASERSYTNEFLQVAAQAFSADRVILLREHPRGSGNFRQAGNIGHPGANATFKIRNRILQFQYTTRSVKPEYPATAIATYAKRPFILWTYDAGTGLALIIANARETNVSRPWQAEDHEVARGAIEAYLDGLNRLDCAGVATGTNMKDVGLGLIQETLGNPISEAELETNLRLPGGKIVNVFIAERKAQDEWHYVIYMELSWSHGYRVLRAAKTQKDKIYKDCSRAIRLLRDVHHQVNPIPIITMQSEMLPASVWIREIRKTTEGKVEPASEATRSRAAAKRPPAPVRVEERSRFR